MLIVLYIYGIVALIHFILFYVCDIMLISKGHRYLLRFTDYISGAIVCLIFSVLWPIGFMFLINSIKDLITTVRDNNDNCHNNL